MGNPMRHRLSAAEEASGMLAACTLDSASSASSRRDRVLSRRIARLREPRRRIIESASSNHHEISDDSPSHLLAPLAEFENRLRAIMSMYSPNDPVSISNPDTFEVHPQPSLNMEEAETPNFREMSVRSVPRYSTNWDHGPESIDRVARNVNGNSLGSASNWGSMEGRGLFQPQGSTFVSGPLPSADLLPFDTLLYDSGIQSVSDRSNRLGSGHQLNANEMQTMSSNLDSPMHILD